MRFVKPSSEDEMVYEFLKMEFSSGRYREQIQRILAELRVPERIVTHGDIASAHENALRSDALRLFRGYRENRDIFHHFPAAIDWSWMLFGADEFDRMLYMEYSYWNELSNYTGSPREAGQTVLSGRTVFGVSNDNFHALHSKLRAGGTFPPLICLTDAEESRYILLEGHARCTGYALEPALFRRVSVLLGRVTREQLYHWYGTMPKRPTA